MSDNRSPCPVKGALTFQLRLILNLSGVPRGTPASSMPRSMYALELIDILPQYSLEYLATMTDLSTDERAKLGANLIEQAPPGEVK